jgi:hypothetical protein
MNENNFEFLASQLKFLGFPALLREPLQEKLMEGSSDFTLEYDGAQQGDLLTALIFFKRPDGYEHYFLNNYHLLVRTESCQDGFGQIFYVAGRKKQQGQEYHKQDFTLKEAYNLLARLDSREYQRFVYGKWMNRNGEIYGGWKGLDAHEKDKRGNFLYNTFHDHYGFSLEDCLSRLPIQEKLSHLPDLIRSLKKGNLQAVTSFGGHAFYIAAYPPGKRINIFDASLRPVRSFSDDTSSNEGVSFGGNAGLVTGPVPVESDSSLSMEEPGERDPGAEPEDTPGEKRDKKTHGRTGRS